MYKINSKYSSSSIHNGWEIVFHFNYVFLLEQGTVIRKGELGSDLKRRRKRKHNERKRSYSYQDGVDLILSLKNFKVTFYRLYFYSDEGLVDL